MMKEKDIDFCARCIKNNQDWNSVKFDLSINFVPKLLVFYSLLSFILLNKEKYPSVVYYIIGCLTDYPDLETLLSDRKWWIFEISIICVVLLYLILGFLFTYCGFLVVSTFWFSLPFFFCKIVKFLNPVKEILKKHSLIK